MAEYIERWALNSSCKEIYEETVREHKDMTAEEVRKLLLRFEKAIKQAPTADVVEVRHGEWLVEYDKYWEKWRIICPYCKNEYTSITKHLENYCSNCGVKMDGERWKDNNG